VPRLLVYVGLPASRENVLQHDGPTELLPAYKREMSQPPNPPFSFDTIRIRVPLMAPYFIRNLIPRRQAHDANRGPLLQVLLSLTAVQWAHFLTGYDSVRPPSSSAN
jgi:hypothetical protein